MLTAEFTPIFASWRVTARRLLRQGVPPDQVWWQPVVPGLDVINPDASQTKHQHSVSALHLRQTELAFGGSANANDNAQLPQERIAQQPVLQPRASKAFITLAERVSCHRRPDRWALLYALLWRMNQGEPQLLLLASDPLVQQVNKMAKSINRDVHKMKAFVRFKTVCGQAGAWSQSLPCADDSTPEHEQELRYVAWFAPEHAILPLVTPFFMQRFSNMRWSILTPDGCVHWEGQPKQPECSLWFSPAVDKTMVPLEDECDQAWQVYYRHIFNPARLKITAMQSEMPQKYWQHLPEAALIGELIQNAMQATGQMLAAKLNPVELNCGPRPTLKT